MNFTREPIIETIITPKEGNKLVVRNSKGSGHEEYIVDAVEVVSFGHSFFFRSMERPKSFLVPVSDFEIIETKETRVVLKNATFERSIKIGGGKKEKPPQAEIEEQEPAAVEQRLEKKRERRRHRRRRGAGEDEKRETEEQQPPKAEEKAAEGGGRDGGVPNVPSSTISRLIPPPPHLIADKIAKERPPITAPTEKNVLPELEEEFFFESAEEGEEEKPKRFRRKKKEETGSSDNEPPTDTEGGGEVSRVMTESPEVVTSTSFSTLDAQYEPFGKFW